MNIEEAKREMIEDWSGYVGATPMPRCVLCQDLVETFEISADPLRDEYLFQVGCHGDKQIYRMPFWYAAQIGQRLEKRKEETGTPDFRWNLPESFDEQKTTRIEGILYQDLGVISQEAVNYKQAEKLSELEVESRKEFEDSFKFEEKRGNVLKIDNAEFSKRTK